MEIKIPQTTHQGAGCQKGNAPSPNWSAGACHIPEPCPASVECNPQAGTSGARKASGMGVRGLSSQLGKRSKLSRFAKELLQISLPTSERYPHQQHPELFSWSLCLISPYLRQEKLPILGCNRVLYILLDAGLDTLSGFLPQSWGRAVDRRAALGLRA